MARITWTEKTEALEAETRALTATILKSHAHKSLTAQGSEGAEADFTDPKKLEEIRNGNYGHLSLRYNHEDNS